MPRERSSSSSQDGSDLAPGWPARLARQVRARQLDDRVAAQQRVAVDLVGGGHEGDVLEPEPRRQPRQRVLTPGQPPASIDGVEEHHVDGAAREERRLAAGSKRPSVPKPDRTWKVATVSRPQRRSVR
jgi:hypothetical protein